MTGTFTSDLLEAVRWFLITTPALAALFLILLFLATLVQVRLPEARVHALFRQRSAPTRYIAGAALGAITPFCSMTTMPVLAGLLRSGAPFGPTITFLVASPLLDGVILGVLVFLIGPKLAALYAALTFLAAIGIGALLARLGFEADVRDLQPRPWRPAPVAGEAVDNSLNRTQSVSGGAVANAAAPSPTWRRAWDAVRQAGGGAWGAFVPLVPHLVLGTAVGAAVRVFLPVGWILALAGPDQPFAIPLMAALGLPLYINAEILLPVTAALLDKGMGIGAVMALVITGLGMSASGVILLTGFFSPRTIAALVLSFFAVAVGGGALATLVAG